MPCMQRSRYLVAVSAACVLGACTTLLGIDEDYVPLRRTHPSGICTFSEPGKWRNCSTALGPVPWLVPVELVA